MDDATSREARIGLRLVDALDAMRGAVWLLEGVHEPGCDPNDPNKMCRVCLAGLGLYGELSK